MYSVYFYVETKKPQAPKTVMDPGLDSTPWIPDSRSRIPVFVSGTLRPCIPIFSGIPDSLSCIPDSKA